MDVHAHHRDSLDRLRSLRCSARNSRSCPYRTSSGSASQVHAYRDRWAHNSSPRGRRCLRRRCRTGRRRRGSWNCGTRSPSLRCIRAGSAATTGPAQFVGRTGGARAAVRRSAWSCFRRHSATRSAGSGQSRQIHRRCCCSLNCRTLCPAADRTTVDNPRSHTAGRPRQDALYLARNKTKFRNKKTFESINTFAIASIAFTYRIPVAVSVVPIVTAIIPWKEAQCG